MEATFGKDEIWARDTQKILAQQQIESNLSQTEPISEWTANLQSRPRTPAEPPVLDVEVQGIDHSKKPTADWFAGASDSSDGSSDSGRPRRLGRTSGERRRVSLTLEHAMRASGHHLPHEDDEESTSSEDMPLNQVKAQAAKRQFPPTLQLDSVGGGLSQNASSSDDEELPLSQLLSQKKGALSDIPHLSTQAEASGKQQARQRIPSPKAMPASQTTRMITTKATTTTMMHPWLSHIPTAGTHSSNGRIRMRMTRTTSPLRWHILKQPSSLSRRRSSISYMQRELNLSCSRRRAGACRSMGFPSTEHYRPRPRSTPLPRSLT